MSPDATHNDRPQWPREDNKVDLLKFTFGSLYFCGTRFETFRGAQMLAVVNDCYMHFIRAGWAAPLAFVLDVSAMLLYGGVAFTTRWKEAGVPPFLQELALDYYKMLQRLRHSPKFRHVARLVASTRDARRRLATVRAFLRFLLAELSEFRETVAFTTRQVTFHNLQPAPDGLRSISFTTPKGRRDRKRFRFVAPAEVLSDPVVSILAQMMRRITDYYNEHPLEEFLSDEELFLIDYAARSDGAAERLDYHLLHRVLRGDDIAEPDTFPPLSLMTEEMLPTESYQQDGQVGGYIDVNLKRLSERVSEILPAEFALKDYPLLLFDKMINEGMLHYIREDIERIEPELRVLFYFLVDASQPMLRPVRDAHERLAAGLTPWVRGKAVFFDILRDLVRFFPRRNVRADVVLYLWGPETAASYRQAFDLFGWAADRAGSRYTFAADFAESAPAFFHYQLQDGDQPAYTRLLADPYKNFAHLCEERRYHCRHLVLFTSQDGTRRFLPASDLGLVNEDYSRDSAWLVFPEVRRPTIGIARPPSLSSAAVSGPLLERGALTEERLRSQFLEAVLLKAAAHRPQRVVADVGDTEHG